MLWKTQPDDELKNKGHGKNHSQLKYSIFHHIFNFMFNQHYYRQSIKALNESFMTRPFRQQIY